MMDFQIYADIVRRNRIEEAERERLIQAAREDQKNGPTLLGRLVNLLKGNAAGTGKPTQDPTAPLDLRKRSGRYSRAASVGAPHTPSQVSASRLFWSRSASHKVPFPPTSEA